MVFIVSNYPATNSNNSNNNGAAAASSSSSGAISPAAMSLLTSSSFSSSPRWGGIGGSSTSSRSSGSSRGSRSAGAGIFVSTRVMLIMAAVVASVVVVQNLTLVKRDAAASTGAVATVPVTTTVHHAVTVNALLQENRLYQQNDDNNDHNNRDRALVVSADNNNNKQCRFYLAPSAIAGGGLGVFAGTGLLPGDTIGFPDLCIYVADAPKKWTHMRSHTWGRGKFWGHYEGRNPRAACEGVSTTLNTNPDAVINTAQQSPVLATTAGLRRDTAPGAGAISHYFGITSTALDVITAGSELTHYYGDWDFDPKKKYTTPRHSLDYLHTEGWCMDNLYVKRSTNPDMGRGAFASRDLAKGVAVAPAPLQCFQDRSIFQKTTPEQLYVNYCLQPAFSTMIFYPYGAGVNLINHAAADKGANVAFRWAANKTAHHGDWLRLSLEEFWNVVTPGGLVLEVYAVRDIAAGEELFMDYGKSWERAWEDHVRNWSPPAGAADYVYPEDMDETEPLRTVKEQANDPYPSNLHTMCNTPDWSRDRTGFRGERHITWWDRSAEEERETSASPDLWWENMAWCHVIKRHDGAGNRGDPVYTVEIDFNRDPAPFDPSKPMKRRVLDKMVPRRAIRFMERPYHDDEHIPGAFRHPIQFPEHLVPPQWNNKIGRGTVHDVDEEDDDDNNDNEKGTVSVSGVVGSIANALGLDRR